MKVWGGSWEVWGELEGLGWGGGGRKLGSLGGDFPLHPLDRTLVMCIPVSSTRILLLWYLSIHYFITFSVKFMITF